MKKSKQNDREIRVQDDSTTENLNARSLLTFRKLQLVDTYMQSQKTQRKVERRFL